VTAFHRCVARRSISDKLKYSMRIRHRKSRILLLVYCCSGRLATLSLSEIDPRLIRLAGPLEETWKCIHTFMRRIPVITISLRKRKFDIAPNPRVSQNEGNLILRE